MWVREQLTERSGVLRLRGERLSVLWQVSGNVIVAEGEGGGVTHV